MHVLSPSLSATALSFFVVAILAATDAQSGGEETFTRSGTTTVIDLCKLAPTGGPSTTTVPHHPQISHPDSLAGCLTTVIENGVTAVISLCNNVASTTTVPHLSKISHPDSLAGCLTTVIKNGFKTVISLCKSEASVTTARHISKIGHPKPFAGCLTTVTKNGIKTVLSICNGNALPITDSMVATSAPSHADVCLTTLTGADGHRTVSECGNLGKAVTPTTTASPPAQTPISHSQFNTACLTTLTKSDGHVVVVNCGDGFFAGHPPTTTAPAPASTPTTFCIEDRCFEVFGTFGSATSTAAAPTKTHFPDEL